jgi:hypothetical protein
MIRLEGIKDTAAGAENSFCVVTGDGTDLGKLKTRFAASGRWLRSARRTAATSRPNVAERGTLTLKVTFFARRLL